MKIAIIGHSGSGKSTLARNLAEKYGCDVLHLDTMHFLPNWVERPANEQDAIVKAFVDAHESWVIDGNYSKYSYERRMAEADLIILMQFNRFACLFRAWRRFKTFKGKTRPDMTEGCDEKFDAEFVFWILRNGRNKRIRERYKSVRMRYAEKVVVIRNQRELDAFKRKYGLNY